jgi:DNA-directed RNA polymerase omega subunit
MYKLPENMDSKYAFVSIAASRAEQLLHGALPRTEHVEGRKLTIIAQEEVARGLVQALDLEEEPASEEAEESEAAKNADAEE